MHMEIPPEGWKKEAKQAQAHADFLRHDFDQDRERYLRYAKRGNFPGVRYEWQLPWELRIFKIVEDALEQSFGSEVIEEADAACWIAMCGMVEAISDDLLRGLPWWRRIFLSRKRLEAEMDKRAKYLAGW